MKGSKKIILFFVSMTLMTLMSALGATIPVSSIAELRQALQDAQPGDRIVLKKGVYTATEDIKINRQGTARLPIILEAETWGSTEITGQGGIQLLAPASYIIIRGFLFTHAASKARSGPGTRFCQWSQNVFQTPGKGEYLTIAGDHHEIDYNTFQNKTEMGRILAIRGEGNQVARNLWIHHNYFFNFPDQGGANGAETLQFGLSGYSLSASNSLVEFNLFEACAGENELISVKASQVVLRYNTIRDCPAQFTLRHGNRNQVYGNYFLNTPGLRIFGDDHRIASNYFENCDPAITIGNGGAEVADGAPLTSHDRPDRVIIAYNTLVNNKKNIIQPARKNGLGSVDIQISNNIIQGGEAAITLAGPYLQPVWTHNLLYHTKGAGDFPDSSFRSLDPQLVKDGLGVFHLQKGSPAIAAGQGRIEAIGVDMDGQPRKGVWDIGADQLSSAPIKNPVLNKSDVGPKGFTKGRLGVVKKQLNNSK